MLKDLPILWKEFEFYSDIDRKLRSNILVKEWYNSLSQEEKELLQNEIKRIINQILENVEVDFTEIGRKIFNGIRLGI